MKALARRAFLRMAPALPIAAKAAADGLVERLAGVVNGSGAPFPATPPSGGPSGTDPTQFSASSVRQMGLDWLRKNGLPDFEREEIWRNYTHVTAIDPDIAAKRSWSPAVRILTQRQRNFDRIVNARADRLSYRVKSDAFSLLHRWWNW